MIEQVDFGHMPWYHRVWFMHLLVLLWVMYPYFMDEDDWPY